MVDVKLKAVETGRARKRKGQLALIGVIVLASTLIALLSLYELQPKVAYERGHLQAAQLVHLARACMASGSCTKEKLALLVQRLYQLNQSYPLRVYVMYVVQAPNPGSVSFKGGAVSVVNTTVFEIETLQALFTGARERVTVEVSARSEPTGRRYPKQVGEKTYTMVEVKVTYTHVYASPFFNVALCPALRALDSVADLKRLSGCEWLVGVPSELAQPADISAGVKGYRYDLRDEFGVQVPVLYRG